MNKVLKVSLLSFVLIFAASLSVSAQIKPSKKKTTPSTQQPSATPSNNGETTKPSSTASKKSSSKKTDQYFDERGGFKHKLQYAAHMNPSIASLFGGQFNIRVDPSVGYKINKWAMAGLTGSIDYTNLKYSFQGASGIETYKYNALNFAYGAYARAKLFNSFYAHTDYKLARYVRVNESTPFDQVNKKINSEKTTLPEFNVGAAYRTGAGVLATEFMVAYNVLYKDATYATYKSSPFDIKIGLTYNF